LSPSDRYRGASQSLCCDRSPGSAPDDDEFDFDADADAFGADEFDGAAPASPAQKEAAAAVEEEPLFSQEDGEDDVIEEGSDRAAACVPISEAFRRAVARARPL
jgi:hypothetical protein